MECRIAHTSIPAAYDASVADKSLIQGTVSWNNYEVAILRRALEVYSKGWEPDAIVCTGPDGFYFGDALSRLFKKTVGVKMTSPCFGKLSIVLKELQGQVLLVNSLGEDALVEMMPLIQEEHPAVTEVKTASVYSQISSEFFLPTAVFNRFDLQQLSKDLLALIPESHYSALAQKMLNALPENPKEMLSQGNYIDLPLEVINEMSCEKIEENSTASVPKHMNVTWNDYEVTFLSLAFKIYKDWQPDSILCVGRGGLYIGEALAKLFKATLGVTMASSYSDEEHTQNRLRIAEHVSIVGKELHGRLLVIDDLVDTGGTMKKLMELMAQMYTEVTEVKTAVVYRKAATTFSPNYFGDEVAAGRWIFLPNEVFDRFDLGCLLKELIASLNEEQLLKLAQSLLDNLPESPDENLSPERHRELALAAANG